MCEYAEGGVISEEKVGREREGEGEREGVK